MTPSFMSTAVRCWIYSVVVVIVCWPVLVGREMYLQRGSFRLCQCALFANIVALVFIRPSYQRVQNERQRAANGRSSAPKFSFRFTVKMRAYIGLHQRLRMGNLGAAAASYAAFIRKLFDPRPTPATYVTPISASARVVGWSVALSVSRSFLRLVSFRECWMSVRETVPADCRAM